jgi:hypothetical protein
MENYLLNCYKYLQNKIQISSNLQTDSNDYKLIERKRKIFYFSKFSLDINELVLIFRTIRTIKENILKNLIDSIKFCSRGKSSLKQKY